MKTLIRILSLLLLLSIISCGNKQSTLSLKVTSSFSLGSGGYTGGLIVSGKNAENKRFVKSIFGGNDVNVVLPNGSWEINVVGWDGPAPTGAQAPATGTPYCGKATVNLTSDDATVNITANNSTCLTSDFSGGNFSTASIIRPLRITTCGSFYKHSSSSTYTKLTDVNHTTASYSTYCTLADHPFGLRSQTRSMKFVPYNKDVNGGYQPMMGANPYCFTSNNGVFILSQQVPVKGLPFQISLYKDNACEREIISLPFPDGILQGNTPKFDSLFDYSLGEASNRLTVSDNEMGRGWSALYDLMPDIKCTNGFCGEIPPAAMFDYFAEVDYQGAMNDQPTTIKIPSALDICASFTVSTGGNHRLDGASSTCAWFSNNGESYVLISLLPMVDVGSCSDMVGDICRSPEHTFEFMIGGNTKKVYFQGDKDYQALGYMPVRFSLDWVFVRPAVNPGTTTSCGVYNVLTSTPSGADTLIPDASCGTDMMSQLSVKVKPSYDYSAKTYRVSEYPATANGKVTFSESPGYMNLAMLPPDERTQKDVMFSIANTIGSANLISSFQNFLGGPSKGDDEGESKKNGSLRRIREMFSPDGPASLFDHTQTCAGLTGTRSITDMKDGQLVTHVVTIQDVSSASADLKVKRPDTMCLSSNPSGNSAACLAGSTNVGRFEKQMTITENGVTKEVLLFDCTQKAGRLESVYNENYEGASNREKEIIFWNTQDTSNARFEKYSIVIRVPDPNFPAITESSRTFESALKTSPTSLSGRLVEYRTRDFDSSHSIKNLRYSVAYSGPDYNLVYSQINSHEPTSTDFFPASGPSVYATLKNDTLGDKHFCMATYSFPFDLASNCSAYTFASEIPPVLAIIPRNYQYVQPTNFDSIIFPGFIPVSW